MKNILLAFAGIALFLVFLAPMAGHAQGDEEKLKQLMENTTPQQRADLEDVWMKKNLNLSPVQMEKVHAINLQTAERMQEVYNSDEGKFRKMREVMSVRDSKDQQLQGVMTGEQYSKYQEKKEEMQEKMQEMKK